MQQSEITKLYKGVIEEVIKNVRNDFVNMGVDEQVLYDLQMLWEQKLMDYKVISPTEYFGNNMMLPGGGIPLMSHSQMMGHGHLHHGHVNAHGITEGGLNVLASGAAAASASIQGQNVQSTGYPYAQPSDNYGGFIRSTNNNINNNNSNNRTTYYHPSQGYFEAPTAANLPNYSTNGINTPNNNNNNTNNNSSNNTAINNNTNAKPPRRYDGAGDDPEGDEGNNPQAADEIIKLLYNNGQEEVILTDNNTEVTADNLKPAVVNEEVNDDDEINSDLDDDDDEDDQDADAEGYDESGAAMDENVVLCQYEKVNRTRNKWRCVFKSGIIHVNGQDYVFSKANGEFEW